MSKTIAKRQKFLTKITSKLTVKELKRIGALSQVDLSTLISGAYGTQATADCSDCADCADCSDCSDCSDSAAIKVMSAR